MSGKPVRPRELANLDVEEAVLVEPAHVPGGHAHELGLHGFRAWPLKRYPYVVFYVERDDHIDIWRVFHAARDIPAWMAEPD